MNIDEYLLQSRIYSLKTTSFVGNYFENFKKSLELEYNFDIKEIYSPNHEIESIDINNIKYLIFDHSLFEYFIYSVIFSNKLSKNNKNMLINLSYFYLFHKSLTYTDIDLTRSLFNIFKKINNSKFYYLYLHVSRFDNSKITYSFKMFFLLFAFAHEFGHIYLKKHPEMAEYYNNIIDFYIQYRVKMPYKNLIQPNLKLKLNSFLVTFSSEERINMLKTLLKSSKFREEIICDFFSMKLIYENLVNLKLKNIMEGVSMIYLFNVFHSDWSIFLKSLLFHLNNHITKNKYKYDIKICHQDLLREELRTYALKLISDERINFNSYSVNDLRSFEDNYILKNYNIIENYNNLSLYCQEYLTSPGSFYEIKEQYNTENERNLTYEEIVLESQSILKQKNIYIRKYFN